MADETESPASAKVRDLIFAYERTTKPLEDYYERPRAKSIGNALSYKLFRQPNLEFHNMVDIEKELVKIEAHLNYYEVYEKETHVAFQEQLFNVLTSIVSIDPEDQEGAIEMKKKLIFETQKLASELNSRLPFDSSRSRKGLIRTYSTLVRKEEAVVSTTSVKSQERRAILASHNSTLNDGFKSEESLNSTRDSIDLSSRHDESSSIDLNYLDESARSSTPPPQKQIADEAHSSLIPSVSKLKKFFSFRKETKPEIRVTSASYSGISRSQSLNVKTNKYSVIKRSKTEDVRKKEESINENDEDIEKSQDEQITTESFSQESDTSQSTDKSFKPDSSETNVYIEPVKEIEDYREVHNEVTRNVSVSKLKSLFEKSRNETKEGLGLLTQKQNEFSSDLNLPFTAMNLGAYRLKRTISGNYMNFTGLLRNVEVNRKGDLSKSKSLSDLKITNYGYGVDEIDIDNDLSKEIDGDDDFEHVSIDIGKDSNEVNNNLVRNDTLEENVQKSKESVIKVPVQLRVDAGSTEERAQEVFTTETSQTTQRENDTVVLTKSVESLKQTFENLSTSTRWRNKDTNEELRHVVHVPIVESVPITTSVVVESELKVPVQLRTSFTNISQSEIVTGNSSISTANEETNDDIRHILHRTVEPISSTTYSSEEPQLRVPIQLRPGFVNTNRSEQITETTYETKTRMTENKGVKIQEENEPLLKIPVQLRVNNSGEYLKVEENTIDTETIQGTSETLASTGTVEILKQTFESKGTSSSGEVHNEDIKHILHRTVEPILSSVDGSEEPVLKVPIQLRTGLASVNHSQEISGNTYESLVTEKQEVNVHEQKETELKIPIQLRVGVGNAEENVEVIEKSIDIDKTAPYTDETLASQGTVEALKQTFENISSTSSSETHIDDIKHILHRTVEPILSSADRSEEPVLKVPIQLRTGFASANYSQEVSEKIGLVEKIVDTDKTVVQHTDETLASPSTVETLKHTFENLGAISSSEIHTEDTKHILHTTAEPKISNHNSEEPPPKVPTSPRPGFVNVSHSQGVSGTISSSEIHTEDTKHILHTTVEPTISTHNSEEPPPKVPTSPRPDLVNVTHSQGLSGTISSSEIHTEDTKHILHTTVQPIITSHNSEEPTPTVPTSPRPDFVNVIHSQGLSGTTSSILNTTVQSIISNHKSEEAPPKVPGSPRPDFVNVIHSQGVVVAENTEVTVQKQTEPDLKIPIQLRVGVGNREESLEVIEEKTADVQHTDETLVSPGTVETLKHTFENISSTSSSEVHNEDIEHILYRTVEPILSSADGSEEPMLKVPIQLRTGFANASEHGGVIETTVDIDKTVQHTDETLASPGTVEALKQTFENIGSTGSSELHNGDIKHILHRTVESILNRADSSEEPLLKIPVQLRTGLVNVSQSQEVQESTGTSYASAETVKPGRAILKVPVQLRADFENVHHSEFEVIEHSSEHKSETSHKEEVVEDNTQARGPPLKVPVQFRIDNHVATTGTAANSDDVRITTDNERREQVPRVDVTYYGNGQDDAVSVNERSLERARIEEKTDSFMKLLESPSAFSTLLSGSSLSQSQHVSSTSKVSVSYSEKRTVQHTSSTQVSQRIVSSSSSSLKSQQSSQKVPEVLEEPVSYSLLSARNSESPNKESIVTITEVEDDAEEKGKLNVNLKVSQENIIEEILKEADSLENIDEEFEKVLEENIK